MTSSTTTSADAPARKSSIPTLLTVFRIVMGPSIAALVLWAATLFYVDPPLAGLIFGTAFVLFVIAAATDWLDGWAARKLNAVTPLGAALDHCADKVLITCVVLVLAYAALPMELVFAAVVILGRDVAVAGLREGIAAQGKALPVSQLGKWKAAAEMCGVAAFLAFQTAALLGQSAALVLGLYWGARLLLWAAAILALVSGAQYVATLLRKT
ncbi:MAG TPA: CDP-diacylglycerol--glycerol-3-phosphate 3-phosphatidyltransferase [Vitreimonas sp.]|uniref:CDP-diacylglycerol--glycerol-3-phosphate 3-phosphatidyltransferase n=1 Tax=Vitreimonas sp. TaxID=3069702 RepID=UPI002D224FB3|nr:CDP-diacylglycerol--glycerol-3-phosphate 3-phosphatidyltransferase [Vitreimonas sp.]HYD88184.1 CDP-diacylglycerol--glycerol-3-phosphate 3-phosphatidyltransferase [Vitreimonas sp.]